MTEQANDNPEGLPLDHGEAVLLATQTFQRACEALAEQGVDADAIGEGLLAYAISTCVHQRGRRITAQWLDDVAQHVRDGSEPALHS